MKTVTAALLSILFVVFSSPVVGQEVYLKLNVSEGTVEVVKPVQLTPGVYLVGEGETPTNPTGLTQRAIEIRDAAKSLNDGPTAKKLILLCRQLEKMIASETVAGQSNISKAFGQARDILLGSKADRWQGVVDVISAHWSLMVQRGASDGEFSDYLSEVAEGLAAAYPNLNIDDKQLLREILADCGLNVTGAEFVDGMLDAKLEIDWQEIIMLIIQMILKAILS